MAQAIAPSFPDTDEALLAQVVERYQEIGAWNTDPVMTEESFDRLQMVMEQAGELASGLMEDVPQAKARCADCRTRLEQGERVSKAMKDSPYRNRPATLSFTVAGSISRNPLFFPTQYPKGAVENMEATKNI